mgnify:CR=1 FL=1
MITIKELLNKIKWDKNLKQKDYSLFYLDRITNELKEIRYEDIKTIEDNFIVLADDTNIPLHRIKKVAKNNIIIWERK